MGLVRMGAISRTGPIGLMRPITVGQCCAGPIGLRTITALSARNRTDDEKGFSACDDCIG